MSRWIKALAIGLLLTLMVELCVFSQDCSSIRSSVVRVHILANSDSEEDQALKLLVRDAVVEAGAGLLDGVSDPQTARQRLQKALPTLCEVAQQCVYEQGYAYTVNGEVTNMYFTTRTYENGTFPAGLYDAVRFTIGEGQGKNWWCVMYPPLCVSAACDSDTLDELLTDSQTDMVQHGSRYRVRFKVVEWIEGIAAKIRIKTKKDGKI